MLGGGYSSRLNQEIRIKRGLSYGAGSTLDARREAALFRVAVQTKNESAAEVVGLVQAEIDRLMNEPIAADELAARKLTLIGGFSRSVETTAGLATAIRTLVVANRPPAELKERIGQLEAVSAADIQRYAAAHLGAAPPSPRRRRRSERLRRGAQGERARAGRRRSGRARPRAQRRSRPALTAGAQASAALGPQRPGGKANPSYEALRLLGQ